MTAALRPTRLYFFPIAPNPTRVRLYLAEKRAGGAAIELEEVAVNLREGEQRKPEHLARNPMGRLPVIELEDGSFVTESLAIIELLEELWPDPSMLGREPIERARMRELERIAETGVLHPVAWIVHGTRSPLGMEPNPGLAENFRRILPGALRVLDDRLADGRPFLAGDRPTVADCTLQAAFQFARFGGMGDVAGSDFPHLARWDRAYREREPARSVLLV